MGNFLKMWLMWGIRRGASSSDVASPEAPEDINAQVLQEKQEIYIENVLLGSGLL